MSRENKKDAVAALHRERIMKAAEKLFSEKGFVQTTIDDISKASEYSRRTIYAYFENKEDILHHIIEKGLQTLKADIENAVNNNDDFVGKYKAICAAMTAYQRNYPHSADSVNSADSESIELSETSETVRSILLLGNEINTILSAFIENGKESKSVRKEVVPKLTVYVLWSGITALLKLADTKGKFICGQLSVTEDEFLEYGFKQIINSILIERI
ncbi:MAG: TetR/AcrR family transcriptional regulator [Oscillospiraceae bacterium]